MEAIKMIFLQPQILWGIGAAIPAVLAEYLYKTWPSEWPWWYGLPVWIPIQLGIGYCIYRLVSIPNTTLLSAFVAWAFCTTFMRVLVSVGILGENVGKGTWIALGLVVMAQVAKSFLGR